MNSQASTSSSKHRGKGKGWSSVEDKAICRAWLDVSQDPIVSVNQKSDTLYARILATFDDICQQSPGEFQPRTAQAIKSRWTKINRSVSKFVGCMCTIENQNESGSSPDDVLKKAMMLYAEKEGQPFSLMHCYELLLDAPKWKMTLVAPTATQPNEPVGEPEQSSIDNCDLTMTSGSVARPMGQKRAKLELAHNEALHETLRDIAASSQQMADVSQQKLEDSKKRTAALEQMVNHKIMRIDMDKLTPTAQLYYEIIQNRILRTTQIQEQVSAYNDQLDSYGSQRPEEVERAQRVVHSEEESQVEVVPIEFLRNQPEVVVEGGNENAVSFERVRDELVERQAVLNRLEITPFDAELEAINFSYSEND